MQKVKVIVYSEYTLFKEGLGSFLPDDSIELIGQVEDLESLEEKIKIEAPDVVIVNSDYISQSKETLKEILSFVPDAAVFDLSLEENSLRVFPGSKSGEQVKKQKMQSLIEDMFSGIANLKH